MDSQSAKINELYHQAATSHEIKVTSRLRLCFAKYHYFFDLVLAEKSRLEVGRKDGENVSDILWFDCFMIKSQNEFGIIK